MDPKMILGLAAITLMISIAIVVFKDPPRRIYKYPLFLSSILTIVLFFMGLYFLFPQQMKQAEVLNTTSTPKINGIKATVVSTPIFTERMATAQILLNDDFYDPALPGWERWGSISNNIIVEDGLLKLIGRKENGPQLHSLYSFRENEARLLLLKYTDDTEFQISLVSGEWAKQDTWRSWGLLKVPNLRSGERLMAYYSKGSQWNNQKFELRDFADRWYYLLLWKNEPAGLYIKMWEKEKPNVYCEKQIKLYDSKYWIDRDWSFYINVLSGEVDVDSYQEIRFQN